MVEVAPVRNSRILGVFAAIVHGPHGTLRSVEIAGRGIAAEARCNLAILDDKTHRTDAHDVVLETISAYADKLMALSAVEDDLIEAWRRRLVRECDDVAFEEALRGIVRRLEDWPQERLSN